MHTRHPPRTIARHHVRPNPRPSPSNPPCKRIPTTQPERSVRRLRPYRPSDRPDYSLKEEQPCYKKEGEENPPRSPKQRQKESECDERFGDCDESYEEQTDEDTENGEDNGDGEENYMYDYEK